MRWQNKDEYVDYLKKEIENNMPYFDSFKIYLYRGAFKKTKKILNEVIHEFCELYGYEILGKCYRGMQIKLKYKKTPKTRKMAVDNFKAKRIHRIIGTARKIEEKVFEYTQKGELFTAELEADMYNNDYFQKELESLGVVYGTTAEQILNSNGESKKYYKCLFGYKELEEIVYDQLTYL